MAPTAARLSMAAARHAVRKTEAWGLQGVEGSRLSVLTSMMTAGQTVIRNGGA